MAGLAKLRRYSSVKRSNPDVDVFDRIPNKEITLQQVFRKWADHAIPKKIVGPLLDYNHLSSWERSDEDVEHIYSKIHKLKYMQKMSEDYVRSVARIASFDEYEPGEEIYAAGVPVEADNDYMFVVIYGQVDLFEVKPQESTADPGVNSVESANEVGECKGDAPSPPVEAFWGCVMKGSHFGPVDQAEGVAGGGKAKGKEATVLTTGYAARAHTKGPTWLLSCKKQEYEVTMRQVEARELKFKMDWCCRRALFRGVSIAALHDMVEHMSTAKYRPGELVFRQGSESNTLYFVLSGQVELLRQVSRFPGEAPTISESLSASAMRAGAVIQPQASDFLVRLRIAEKGDIFGNAAACNRKPQLYTAVTISEVTLITYPWHHFAQRMDNYTLKIFKNIGEATPDDDALRYMHSQSMALTVPIGSHSVETTVQHLRDPMKEYMLEALFPNQFRQWLNPSLAEIGEYYRPSASDERSDGALAPGPTVAPAQPFAKSNSQRSSKHMAVFAAKSPGIPDWLESSSRMVREERRRLYQEARGRRTRRDEELREEDLPVPDVLPNCTDVATKRTWVKRPLPSVNPDLVYDSGLLKAAVDANLPWTENESALTRFFESFPRMKTVREGMEILDISELSKSEANLQYSELLENACLLVVRLINADTGDLLGHHMLDPLLESWMSFFTDKEQSTEFICVRWSSDNFVVILSPQNTADTSTVSTLMDAIFRMQTIMAAKIESLTAQSQLMDTPVPAVHMVGGVAHGSVFATYSRLGRFILDLRGPCFEVAWKLCSEAERGIQVTDGVRDLAGDTHQFEPNMTGYLLQDRVEFPYQQTHASVFGDTWREDAVSPTKVYPAKNDTDLLEQAQQQFLPQLSLRSRSRSASPVKRSFMDSELISPDATATSAISHRSFTNPLSTGSLIHHDLPQTLLDHPFINPASSIGNNPLRSHALHPAAPGLQAPHHESKTNWPPTQGVPWPFCTQPLPLSTPDPSSQNAKVVRKHPSAAAEQRGVSFFQSCRFRTGPNGQRALRRHQLLPTLAISSPHILRSKANKIASNNQQLRASAPGRLTGPNRRLPHIPMVVTLLDSFPGDASNDKLPSTQPSIETSTLLSADPNTRAGASHIPAFEWSTAKNDDATFEMKLRVESSSFTSKGKSISQPTPVGGGLKDSTIPTSNRYLSSAAKEQQQTKPGPTSNFQHSKYSLEGELARIHRKTAKGDKQSSQPQEDGIRRVYKPRGPKWMEEAWKVSVGIGNTKAAAELVALLDPYTPYLNLSTCFMLELPDISHFKKLEGVCLGFNHLSSFPISIFKHQHLRQLYLNNNYLTAVPEELSRLHALEALNVGQNDLTKLPNSVTTLIKLQVLVVHGNPKLAALPENLGNLVNLRELHAGHCALKRLPDSFARLHQLRRLHLAHNNIQEIPAGFNNMSRLQKFDVSYNQLCWLPPECFTLSELEELYLGCNKLSDLPDDVNPLGKTLKVLSVHNNMLSSLPKDLGTLVKLSDLDIHQNTIDSLPEDLGKLVCLVNLNASRNVLTALPESIADLTRIERILLDHNQIAELPGELGGKAPRLRALSLAHNRIIALPEALKAASRLQLLNLEGNLQIEFPPIFIIEQGRVTVMKYLNAPLHQREAMM